MAAGIFESHDADRFETYAFSIGPSDGSELRIRLERSFHRFVDCQSWNDSAILKAIKDAEIDILVDLAGHTQYGRPALFASGPAPVVVNFLGFAGTMGSKRLSHYIIADGVVVPDTSVPFFGREGNRLPGCFVPRDTRSLANDGATPGSAEHDLPDDRIVFCCFNNACKIDPPPFGGGWAGPRLQRGTSLEKKRGRPKSVGFPSHSRLRLDNRAVGCGLRWSVPEHFRRIRAPRLAISVPAVPTDSTIRPVGPSPRPRDWESAGRSGTSGQNGTAFKNNGKSKP